MQEKIMKYIKPIGRFIIKYSVGFILLIIVAVTLLAISKIDKASNAERDESQYNLLLQEVRVIKFDEDTIQAIRDLKASGAKIDSDFPTNRKNPF
jgi:hypothetical protein